MVQRLSIMVLIAFCLSAYSCSTTSAWVKPIYISKDDVLTEGTAKQVAIHNETWEKNK